jgi:hypothetical protein
MPKVRKPVTRKGSGSSSTKTKSASLSKKTSANLPQPGKKDPFSVEDRSMQLKGLKMKRRAILKNLDNS